MRIAIYADKKELKILEKLTIDYCAESNWYPVIDSFDSKDKAISTIAKCKYSIVIIAIEQENSLEAVKNVHLGDSEAKIIWFSDDTDCASYAFENDVKQFSLRPVSKEKLYDGFERCGIYIGKDDICRVHIKAEERVELS